MDLIFHPWNVRNCSPPLSFIERNFKLQLTKNTARIPPYPRSWKMSGWRTERVKGMEGGGGGAVEITLMVRVVLWRQGGRGESVSLVRSFGRGGARSSENRVPVNGEHLSSSSSTLNPLQHCKIWRQWKSSIRYTPLSKKYFRPIFSSSKLLANIEIRQRKSIRPRFLATLVDNGGSKQVFDDGSRQRVRYGTSGKQGKKRFEEERNWNVCLHECLSPSTWNVEIVIHTISRVYADGSAEFGF